MGSSEFIVLLVLFLHLGLGDGETINSGEEDFDYGLPSYHVDSEESEPVPEPTAGGGCPLNPNSKNSAISCQKDKCIVRCLFGYQLPNGSLMTSVECINGQWQHGTSGKPGAPDCEPICNPKCQNGGICISKNVCECPEKYGGAQCERDKQVCAIEKTEFDGNFNCTFGDIEASCQLTCPDSFFFSGPESSEYVCQYSTGQFLPPLPSCVYNENEDDESSVEITKATNFYSLYNDDMTIDDISTINSAICATWMGVNVKTFDGQMFKSPLSYSHTLVSDKTDGTFDITLKGCPYGSGYNCPHSLKIFWQSVEYNFQYINGTIKLSTPQTELTIPVQVKGMRVLHELQHLRIDLDQVGLSILWDKAQFVIVQASAGLLHRTGGICGLFDGDHFNDFMSKDDVRLEDSKEFIDSWKIIDYSTFNVMDSSSNADLTAQCNDQDLPKAQQVCEDLLNNPKLIDCTRGFNMNYLKMSCEEDYCNCANKEHPELCNCDLIAMLSKECQINDIKLEHGWRNLQICPIECSFGRIYMPCGPNIEQTCGSDLIPNKDKCYEGCFCPEGTVLHKDSCITPELCPCTMRNKEFKAGSTIKRDCNTCNCQNGVWKCTEHNCGARCSVIGEVHYTTFDGKKFDFMGTCSYYLLKTDNTTIEVENGHCYVQQSCVKSLTITTDIGGIKTTIKLSQNHETHVNDKEILKLPKTTGNNQILIRQASSMFIRIDLPDGITVLYGQTEGTIYIDASPSLREKTSGLCGTFNSNTQDDFLTPEGDTETTVAPFAIKWRTKDTCADQSGNTALVKYTCSANPHMLKFAEKHCAWLTGDIFLDCHWAIDPKTYYDNCIADVCACKEDPPSKCVCPILSNYASDCANRGIKTGWRYSVKECAIECPVGQIYDECGDSCARNCADLASKKNCQSKCIEGCRCPNGLYLNDNNECVPDKNCPCLYDGESFKTGYKEVRQEGQSWELCTCQGGFWEFHKAEEEDKIKYPPSSELKRECAKKPNAKFSKCMPAVPKTCKNANTYIEDLEDCEPGCACMEGFVYDVTTKECVTIENCPCHHAGKSYDGGDQIIEDCNVCYCKSGNWECTKNECDRTCSVWGDSHFTTFDNNEFDFQGACDYILSKGVAANGDSYSITIQNVICGTLGVTCSKSLVIELDGSVRDSIKLSATSSYLEDKSRAPIDKLRKELGSKIQFYNIYKSGLFTVIEIIPLKLQVKWDEGTRVYVKLGRNWKGKVNGLCGNYNDNANDDMKTQSQSLETSPFLFGHSWKLSEQCVAPTQQINACKEHPERATWAELKCGILKSSAFKECHSEVPVEKFLQRCIFDTCACDQGGDCECLCTAVAAYVHSCSAKGISIQWRTQHFCPMQCDPHCSEYKPCTPACAVETCDNFLDQGITDRMCLNENCIEGCQIKPCDEGMIYLNDSFTKCVPKSECKPVCMLKDGKTFYEGDITFVDNCQTCRCTQKKEVCSGLPCPIPTTTPRIDSPSKNDTKPIKNCTSGWTRWINRDQLLNNNHNIKLDDREKLPNYNSSETIYASCEKEFMKDINCREVSSQGNFDLMDDDVYCNLEDGLVCNGICHDYETRVFCQCEPEVKPPSSTTMAPSIESCFETGIKLKEHTDDCYKFFQCVQKSDNTWDYVENTCGPSMMFNPIFNECEAISIVQATIPKCGNKLKPPKPDCPSGRVWSECANYCEHTCHYFGQKLSKRGLCNPGEICKPGCVDETKPYCPGDNKLWWDENTCVDIDACPCMSSDDQYIKPHSVLTQVVSNIEQICQCIDNNFFCTEIITPSPPDHITPSVDEGIPYCPKELLIPIINGTETVFNASSWLSKSYLPKYSRLDSKAFGESKGSWSPDISDQSQYLQVSFDEPKDMFGIIMQGSPVTDQRVTLFKISYSSDDGLEFQQLLDEKKRTQMFKGPADSNTHKASLFKVPIKAKVVRIHPLKWHGGISMRIELLGCNMDALPTTPRIPIITTTESTVCQECQEPMGVDNGAMDNSQVKASSIWPQPKRARRVHLIDMLKLSTSTSWRPDLNSPDEYIEFDFLEPRNITGMITKGGLDGWVSGYKVEYLENGTWKNALATDTNQEVFIANYDGDSEQKILFKNQIRTQILKVLPNKWNKNINIRIEPLGCFKPYPKINGTTPLRPDEKCPICENVIPNPDDINVMCNCDGHQMWDGNKCVNKNMCPCVENYFNYPIGSKFETKKCEECVCLLGGVKKCKPKTCPPCPANLRHTWTSTCDCECEPCPKNYKLCPTNEECIQEKFWCNGIKDCVDDEPEDCPSTDDNGTIFINCQRPKCQQGYKIEITERNVTREMSVIFETATSKTYIYNISQAILPMKKYINMKEYFPNAELESDYNITEQCDEFVCTPTTHITHVTSKCSSHKCPNGYITKYDKSRKTPSKCPVLNCILRRETDHICELSGKSIKTFDGTDFKYEICSHLLARDLVNSSWFISTRLNCIKNGESCPKELIVKDVSANVILTISRNQQLTFNGFNYKPKQLKNSKLIKSIFTIEEVGKTILVVSRKHRFWVEYHEIGTIKVGISDKLIKKVDGLCGYFDGKSEGDKRFPNGTLTAYVDEFGDGWFDEKVSRSKCYPQECSKDIQMKALFLCNSIKHDSFAECNTTVDSEQFVSKCIETTCDCLKANKGDPKSCKCSILQEYVKQCLAGSPEVKLDTCRAEHQCEISCPGLLVPTDCFKRRCEPSCNSIQEDDCPVLEKACFSGCFCPEGTLRQGDTCIPINECRDCICNTFGASKYFTYDKRNFTFNGNCTYLLSRDFVPTDLHKFQVYVTMGRCPTLAFGPNASCAKSLHILSGEHVIHIQDIEPMILVDSKQVKKLPFKNNWLSITETNRNEFKFMLDESHVEVTSSFSHMAFSIRVPSIIYGNKMEGLCGDCNGNPNDDLKIKSTSITTVDVSEIVESWKAHEPKLGLDVDHKCSTENVTIDDKCKPPMPNENDPCLKFYDIEIFGKCNIIVNPAAFVSLCRQDICRAGENQTSDDACNSLAAYARECAINGVFIDWRSYNLCPYECPSSMVYEACGSLKTCDTLNNPDIFEVEADSTKTVIVPKKEQDCVAGNTEGCFCPRGTVMDDGNCIPEKECIKCEDGFHFIGDSWKKDKCTECSCNSHGKTECVVERCSVEKTICLEGFVSRNISSSEDCCERNICVPKPPSTINQECPNPLLPKCGDDQIMKETINSDNCTQLICECKPESQCEPLPESMPLSAGQKIVIDKSGCCPKQTIICEVFKCPKLPTKCSRKFYKHKIVPPTECCPSIVCTPPKDQCVAKIDEIEVLKNVGDKWSIPDEPCIQEQCTYGSNDRTQIIELVEKCETECKKGYEYMRPNATKCCGSCVQTKCFFEDKLYSVGDQWFNEDNCTNHTCANNNGQLLVVSTRDVCMDASDCPNGFEETSGCCKKCKPPTRDQVQCFASSLSENNTKGLVKVKSPEHGLCLNIDGILGFTHCEGTCLSGSKYNIKTFGQDKECFCCSVAEFKTISVSLLCDDGEILEKNIEIPSNCKCNACVDSDLTVGAGTG